MNKLRELRFGKKEKPDVIDPGAYSQDGYLIHQGRMSGVRYGRRTTRETGCGWIACFNFLKYKGRPLPPLKIAWDLEGMLMWGGRIGSNPLVIWWYLWRKGYHFRLAVTRRGMERLVKRSMKDHQGRVAGVLAYIHRKGAHYTTFIDERSYCRATGEAGPCSGNSDSRAQTHEQAGTDKSSASGHTRVRFLNAVYGVENHCLTVGEFFKKYVKFPLCFAIVAR